MSDTYIAESKRRLAEKLKQHALDPLDYLMGVINDKGAEEKQRLEAAKAAAPYIHSKMASVELSGSVGISHEEALSNLE